MYKRRFDALGQRMLEEGVSPKYVRRYIAELSDHHAMLAAEGCAAGLTQQVAAEQASRQLGDDSELLDSVLRHRAVLTFARRRPAIAFLLLPVPLLYATKALILAALTAAVLTVDACLGSTGSHRAALRPLMHACFDYGAPLVVAALYCAVAHRTSCPPVWPLLSTLVIAVAAGCVEFQMQRVTVDFEVGGIGTGVLTPTVTPVVLVPIAVYAVSVCGLAGLRRTRLEQTP